MKTPVTIKNNGRVIANFGANIAVEDDNATIHTCTARKKLGQIVCGDFVQWEETDNGDGVITELRQRSSLLSRPDQRGKIKTLAANIDQLMIVSAVRTHPQNDNSLPGDRNSSTPPGRGLLENANLIDHYIVAAENIDITPIILVNKIDLPDHSARTDLEAYMSLYTNLGYDVIFTSAKMHIGLDELKTRLHHKTSIYVGESGVGKSSLMNRFLPDINIRTSALSTISGKGKHTTSVTTLYHFPGGGCLIDSPGVREFGLWNITPNQLVKGFKEIEKYIGQCKFRNCQHQSEPECAIKQAVSTGDIHPIRYQSYSQILLSLNKENT